MINFWIITILIFIAVTVVLARFTFKKFRKDTSDAVWKRWDGRATYWQLLSLCSFGITAAILLVLHWLDIAIV